MERVKRKKAKVWLIVLIILGVTAAVLAAGILLSAPGRQEIQELVLADVDFGGLRDGTYVGEYTGKKDHSRDAEVEVTISGGEISGIRILKGALDRKGKPAELTGGLSVDDLFGRVVKAQSLQVDAISGATLTSKAHLKALENALKQAQPE